MKKEKQLEEMWVKVQEHKEVILFEKKTLRNLHKKKNEKSSVRVHVNKSSSKLQLSKEG